MEFLLRVLDPVALIQFKLRREAALRKERQNRAEERLETRREMLKTTFFKMALPGTAGIFVVGNATYKPLCRSVGRSVGLSVCRSVHLSSE